VAQQPLGKPRTASCADCGAGTAMAYSTNGGKTHRWLCGSCVYLIEHPEAPPSPLEPGKRGVVRKQKESLFDALPAEDRIGITKLTERQEFALRAVLDHPDGLSGEDVGRLVHEHFQKHRPGFTTCDFCQSAGLELLRALKDRGLVAQRRGGIYQAIAGSRGAASDRHAADDSYDPQTAPWPEGF
jgi:ribosomal protein S27AE